MTTAANNAITVGQVFRRHGISIAIGGPLMQIQELAMAINLVGRHQVVISYGAMGPGHDLSVMHKPSDQIWTVGAQHLTTNLPTATSTEAQRSEYIQQLGEIVETLAALLAEGEPS